MTDYKNLIILSYFYQYKNNYSILTLQNILGITLSQLEKRLFNLIDLNLVEYQENLLKITSKGAIAVLSNNIEQFPFEFSYKYIEDSDTSGINKINIEDVYIPKNFADKVGG